MGKDKQETENGLPEIGASLGDLVRRGVWQAKVALAALKGDKTLGEPAQQFDVHANQCCRGASQTR